MSTKTFINGQENGVIAFFNDTEPCAVYVNGERQDNISYVPQEVTGVNSVEYSSEYKKNIRTMQIDGNTEQYQKEGTTYPFNLDEWVKTNVPILGMDVNSAETPYIYWETPIPIPTTGTFRLDVQYLSKVLSTDQLNIVIAYSEDDIINRTGSYKVVYPYTEPVFVDQPFYLGAINPSGSINPSDSDMWSKYGYAISSDTIVSFIEDSVPSPYAPSPIQNAGNTSPNLFDIDNPSYVYLNNIGKNYTMKITDGVIESSGVSGVTSGQFFKIDVSNKSNITISFNAEYDETTQTRTVIDVRGINEIGTDDIAIDNKSLIPSDTNTKIVNGANSFTVDVTNYNYLAIAFISIKRYGIKITNLQVKSGYSNYIECVLRGANFHKTLSLPSSVTVDGQEVELRFGIWDNLLVDRVSGKVTYTEGTLYENVSSQAFIDRTSSAFTEGRRWFQMSQTRMVENGLGYCNIVSPTTTDYGNYNHFRVSSAQIAFIVQGFASLTEFNTYKKSNPIIIQCKLREPIEHVLYDKANNITTELGQQILDFVNATQNATNIIEITSTPSVSNLSVNYAKWGGIPNANNT
jgi:hypothetical protein